MEARTRPPARLTSGVRHLPHPMGTEKLAARFFVSKTNWRFERMLKPGEKQDQPREARE
jgi:hypothetical protein